MFQRWTKIAVLSSLLVMPTALPAFSHVQDKSDKLRQARTVDDLRNVGTALMSWLIDNVLEEVPPQVAEERELGWAVKGKASGYDRLSYEAVVELLVPDYIKEVPRLDGWGYPYEFAVNANLLGEHVLSIRSPGRDGEFEGDEYEAGSFGLNDHDHDIVWTDGFFARWPGTE